MNRNQPATKPAPGPPPAHGRRLVPLVVRRRLARQTAAGRIARRTTRGLSPAQRQNDPLARPPRTVANTWVRVV
ncbi:MAG TPA: hypothetical protein VGG33_29430, partial [Polyangia bacterium]